MAAGTFRTIVNEAQGMSGLGGWQAIVAGPIKLVIKVPEGGRDVDLYLGATASPPNKDSEFWKQNEGDVPVSMTLNATDTLWARSIGQSSTVVRMQAD